MGWDGRELTRSVCGESRQRCVSVAGTNVLGVERQNQRRGLTSKSRWCCLGSVIIIWRVGRGREGVVSSS